MPVPPTTTELVLDFHTRTLVTCADASRDLPFGTSLHTPSLPGVWSLNGLTVASAPPSWAELEAALPAAPRPSITFDDVAEADRFADELAGWDVDNNLFMVLADPPRPPAPDAVREGSREEIRTLQREWLAADFAAQGDGVVDQLMDYMDRQWDAWTSRGFVSAGGEAMTLLWTDGRVAQIEDVYTTPAARGRGHARALVSHAAALAASEGYEAVYLVADDDNTPKRLYERLGFRPVHRTRQCVRPAPSA